MPNPQLAPVVSLLLPIEKMSPTCVKLEIVGRLIGMGEDHPIVYNDPAHMRRVLGDLRQEAATLNREQLAQVAAALPGRGRSGRG